MNQSHKKNKEFDAACNLMSEERGIDFWIARNVIRYHKALKSPRKAPIRPAVAVPDSQSESPSVRLSRLVKNGTRPADYSVPVPNDTSVNLNKVNLGLWTKDEFFIAAKHDADFNAFMKHREEI
jgi:hypothetical protein